MKKNIGTVDRNIRIVIAIIVGCLGIWFKSWWGLLALLPLVTALLRFCPVYLLLGISTNKSDRAENKTE